jgi:hypothetical protein
MPVGECSPQGVIVKLLTSALAVAVMMNPVTALGLTSVARAEPSPPKSIDEQFVTTESRTVGCVIRPGTVLCTGDFANLPTRCGQTSDCDLDGLGIRDHTVWVDAEGGGLQWNDSNFQSYGYTPLVLTYGRVFHLKGWTVEPSSAGTRFTNDGTGRGMFVSRQSVTYLAAPAAPGIDTCAAATKEALLAELHPVVPGFDFRRVQCSAPFALATSTGTDTMQSSGYLFRRDGSRWTLLDVGSAMACAQYGVTAADALEGCSV